MNTRGECIRGQHRHGREGHRANMANRDRPHLALGTLLNPFTSFSPAPCTSVQIVKGQVWTFEQTQAFFFDVFTPVRMTVIKLKSGGLWVHAPVAPTQVRLDPGSPDKVQA